METWELDRVGEGCNSEKYDQKQGYWIKTQTSMKFGCYDRIERHNEKVTCVNGIRKVGRRVDCWKCDGKNVRLKVRSRNRVRTTSEPATGKHPNKQPSNSKRENISPKKDNNMPLTYQGS
jgi:hypothetical protein